MNIFEKEDFDERLKVVESAFKSEYGSDFREFAFSKCFLPSYTALPDFCKSYFDIIEALESYNREKLHAVYYALKNMDQNYDNTSVYCGNRKTDPDWLEACNRYSNFEDKMWNLVDFMMKTCLRFWEE